MEIRLLTAGDAEQWWRLRLESLKGDPEAFSASAEDPHSLTLEDVRGRLRSNGANFWVVGAFENGGLHGIAGFHREPGLKVRHKGRVWGVYVTPGSRRKGLGRRMLRILLERAAGIAGVEQILISVATTQNAAAGLYRSLGFEPFGCEPRALKVGDRFIDEEFMVLWLDPQRGERERREKKRKAPSTLQSKTPRQPSPRTAKPQYR